MCTALRIALACFLLPALAAAQEVSAGASGPPASIGAPGDPGGLVQIPRDVYDRLMESARNPQRLPRAAPAGYALGTAQVSITAQEREGRASAEVHVILQVAVLDDDWVLVPLLPNGAAVDSAVADGTPIQLLSSPVGLSWVTKGAGSHQVDIRYRVDASRSEDGFSLPLPLPEAAAINLKATLPGKGLDVALIPAAGVRTFAAGNNTRVQATLPSTRGAQLSWRLASGEPHAVSRATYRGRLAGDAVSFVGEFDVELFSTATVTLPLLHRSTTLSSVSVDGKSSPILVQGDRFATLLEGQGRHQVSIGFEVPISHGEGPPRVQISIPAVPVSRFELTLPGKKEVSATPAANVTTKSADGNTVATVFAPMTESLTLSWTEAVPEEIRTVARANASLFHAAYAEEGVLAVRALVLWEVTRGESGSIELTVPAGVQVNRIHSDSGAVADWRMTPPKGEEPRQVTIFLDRKIRDSLLFEVDYDTSLGSLENKANNGDHLELPLLRAPKAQRQRGMVALLGSRDLALKPVDDGNATRVGENQLPSFVRDALTMPVLHTYKYVEAAPILTVEAIPPERRQGKLDAQVDTLISLGEVTLSGAASVGVEVKSGSVMDLILRLPEGVELLNLTGPSVRDFQIQQVQEGQQSQQVQAPSQSGAGTPSGKDPRGQEIRVQFTQEMEGQFRLEMTYERILATDSGELAVPLVAVEGAEVDQGRVAVEALSAVEVQATAAEQLTALDIAELPQQLVLRTTNPILLAYKYVRSTPEPRLALSVTRHRLLTVQEAAIDRADYRSLFTRDGLAVTTATFLVRNSRKQFLRIRLPRSAEVWSAFVDGHPEKPAAAEDGESVLLKIVHSTRGFPVQLIYATRENRIRGLGRVQGQLPRPDILVTESRWDVYLPAEMRYERPQSNLDVADLGTQVEGDEMKRQMTAATEGTQRALEPLRLSVPTAGVRFAFTKLYANQGDEEAWFRVPYSSSTGTTLGVLVSLGAALLLWIAGGLWRTAGEPRRRMALGLAATGFLLFLGVVVFYGVSPWPAILLSAVIAGVVVALRLSKAKAARRETAKATSIEDRAAEEETENLPQASADPSQDGISREDQEEDSSG